MLHDVAPQDRPVIVDWIIRKPRFHEQRATIVAILPRKSCFMRKQAGRGIQAQSIAANVGIAFLVMTLGADFNTARLGRYLALAAESGATPVIVLSKSDLCQNTQPLLNAIETCAPNVPAHLVSSRHGEGLTEIAAYLLHDKTVVLLGSSNAGKSTLLNALFQEKYASTGALSFHRVKRTGSPAGKRPSHRYTGNA